MTGSELGRLTGNGDLVFSFRVQFPYKVIKPIHRPACSTDKHCHARILFLSTYAKIAYVSVRTYLSKIKYVRYVSSSLASVTTHPLFTKCVIISVTAMPTVTFPIAEHHYP